MYAQAGEGGARGSLDEPRALSKWLLQQLSQVGPQPERDAELYRILHTCLDHADDWDAEGSQWHCRLCLAAQTRWVQKRRVRLSQCSHALCENCAKQLVADALAGHIKIPITCPVGCAAGGANNTLGNHANPITLTLPSSPPQENRGVYTSRGGCGRRARFHPERLFHWMLDGVW